MNGPVRRHLLPWPLVSALMLGGCGGSEAEYAAVHELVPDAHVMYLGRHLYLVKSTFGEFSLVTMGESGEVISMERLF